jgi:chromosome segregation ATPase
MTDRTGREMYGVEELLRQLLEGQKQLVDGQSRMEGRLEGMEGRLEGMEGRLEGMEGRLEGMEGRLEGMEGRLEGMEGRLEGIEGRLENVEVQVQENSGFIKALVHQSEYQKVQIDGLVHSTARLEGRVTQGFEDMDGRLVDFGKDVRSIGEDVSFLARKVFSHDDVIRNLRVAK